MKRILKHGQYDVMTPVQRSRCMSRIKGKNTGPEIKLRKNLWLKGYRYRTTTKLLGRPDIVFTAYKIAIFVDGCFWHGCPIHGTKPKANRNFWQKKISGNIVRDKTVTRQLRKAGWKVLRFWEHSVDKDLESVTGKIIASLRG